MNPIPASILDYAGPASRGKLRLPARSDLKVVYLPEGIRVTETLAGRQGAFFALLFGLVTLVMVIGALYSLTFKHWEQKVVEISVSAAVAIAELMTMLLVIDNTWRTTRLGVTPTGIALRMFSPLRGTRAYRWPAEKLRRVSVARIVEPDAPLLFQLELTLWDEPGVHLFTGHDMPEL